MGEGRFRGFGEDVKTWADIQAQVLGAPNVPKVQNNGSTGLPSLSGRPTDIPEINRSGGNPRYEAFEAGLGGGGLAQDLFDLGRDKKDDQVEVNQEYKESSRALGDSGVGDTGPEKGIEGLDLDESGLPSDFRGGENPAGDYNPSKGTLPTNTTQAYQAIAHANKLAIGVFRNANTGEWMLGNIALGSGLEGPDDNRGNPTVTRTAKEDKELIEAAILRDVLLAEADRIIIADADQIAGEGKLKRDQRLSDSNAVLNDQLQTKLEQLRNQNATDLANTQGSQARQTLGEEYRLREVELKEEHTRIKNRLEKETKEAEQLATKQRDLQLTVLEFTNDLQLAMQDAQFGFHAEEAKLDRHLEQQEINEAISSRQAMNLLEIERARIQDAQLKMSFVSMIAQSPEFIYNAQRSGMLQSLGDFLGDGGQLVEQMNDLVVASNQPFVNAAGEQISVGPSAAAQNEAREAGFKPVGQAQSQLLNVQQFGQLSDVKRRQEEFRSRALQGGTAKDFLARLSGPGPADATDFSSTRFDDLEGTDPYDPSVGQSAGLGGRIDPESDSRPVKALKLATSVDLLEDNPNEPIEDIKPTTPIGEVTKKGFIVEPTAASEVIEQLKAQKSYPGRQMPVAFYDAQDMRAQEIIQAAVNEFLKGSEGKFTSVTQARNAAELALARENLHLYADKIGASFRQVEQE